jgi:hypothetical protein
MKNPWSHNSLFRLAQTSAPVDPAPETAKAADSLLSAVDAISAAATQISEAATSII